MTSMFSCNFGKKKFSFQNKNSSADTIISKAVFLLIEFHRLFTRKPPAMQNKPIKCTCYQWQKEIPKTRINSEFSGWVYLLPLNGCWGLTCNIINNSINATDLVNNAARNFLQQVIGDSSPVSGHKIGRGHAAKC